ncbi:formate dehydrogenase accessory sulfurtransferase FdhD [Emcibacter nanhaiensis]|uniref:Sulfur carrier protein FdhD n=1 Tax=Emcibacter nanhaiensis TaxID=1505037 RepID=A0A501PLI0_9PROT|nr:formate dehydrogenase accessory sulfurtransferase FdhD [Emcibacter nanhaiensis]TPD61390.1 formate dehydrogenase accessory sulfurtransferase FdhD [Emcibacter nanhaiensis]
MTDFPTYRPLSATIWSPTEKATAAHRDVACEIPVSIEYNCAAYAVMMVTPDNLEDFVYGFSLTEGIIDGAGDIIGLDIHEVEKGIVAAVEIREGCFKRLENFKRQMAGRTGCGLCGADRLEHVIRPLPPVPEGAPFKAAVIHGSMQGLRGHQPLNRTTGAVHAAAFCDREGDILAVREDVGRHNALDKIIGRLMREKLDPAAGYVLVSSRCSFEMVQKCAAARLPLIAAVSAPTELAIELARQTGVSLAALVRDDNMSLYMDSCARIDTGHGD